jgi:hypothetical protein
MKIKDKEWIKGYALKTMLTEEGQLCSRSMTKS